MKFSNEYHENDKLSPFALLNRIRSIEKLLPILEKDIPTINKSKKELLRSIQYSRSVHEDKINNSSFSQQFIGKETSKKVSKKQLESLTSKLSTMNNILSHVSSSSAISLLVDDES